LRLPGDLSGEDLARRLSRLGDSVTRQTGSPMRLTTDAPKRHHVSIPKHDALRIGTLAGILDDVAAHLGITRQELASRIFD
jgi:predicted RNA binding protein YcfA (HicA-like mRNA interferase family)